jgi:hypothetical protein
MILDPSRYPLSCTGPDQTGSLSEVVIYVWYCFKVPYSVSVPFFLFIYLWYLFNVRSPESRHSGS